MISGCCVAVLGDIYEEFNSVFIHTSVSFCYPDVALTLNDAPLLAQACATHRLWCHVNTVVCKLWELSVAFIDVFT